MTAARSRALDGAPDLPPAVDLVLVAGARPNFMKIAPILHALERDGDASYLLVHTGQHHDFEMSRVFFEDLRLPAPGAYLGPTTGSHAQQTARIMVAFEEVLERVAARLVVVVGDVNSTLACSLVAAKAMVPVAHVEAGLRSFDRAMPEEINRVLTDRLAEILYTTCDDGTANLLDEGTPPGRIEMVGNVMIDTLLEMAPRARALKPFLPARCAPGRYALVTLHRPSNVDAPEALARVAEVLRAVAERLPVVFPIHPRTRKNLVGFGLLGDLEAPGIHLLEPQSYLRFLRLMLDAAVVLTDSGGLQEETTALRIPCLTMRENTERPITVDLGTNRLVGLERPKVEAALEEILRGAWPPGEIPPLWDGRAAERIAAHLGRWLDGRGHGGGRLSPPPSGGPPR